MRRANTGYFDGRYSLPAGHFDGDESAKQVVVREAKEEVGVDIKPQDLKLVHTLHRLSDIPIKNERIDLFFEVKIWKGEITNMEPHKCDELRWVKIGKPPPKMVPEVKQALEKIRGGKNYSEFGF